MKKIISCEFKYRDVVVPEGIPAIIPIVSVHKDLKDRENINFPLYEPRLSEVNVGINNLLNAIQQGVFTESTKARQEKPENNRDELENRIALVKLAKPEVSVEFMTFWLHRFRLFVVCFCALMEFLIQVFAEFFNIV